MDVAVTPLDPGRFGVQVTEGDLTTDHEVVVPEGYRETLSLDAVDDETIVLETFDYLLEREPAAAILRSFSVDEVRDHFPDFESDLRARLA
jgi:bifunctional DNA-binding transcriptional regulator/antitoxin component of YhaV-PrlF toxin-antitoxin module